MSAWTHAICDGCWKAEHATALRGPPVRVLSPPVEVCALGGVRRTFATTAG